MPSTAIASFSGGVQLWAGDVNPNGVITPIRIGALYARDDAGNVTVYQCTAAPNVWVDITAAGGGSGWLHVGTVERLTTLTDTVAIGTAAMLGAEKLRVTGIDATNAGLTDELVVEHQTSGVAGVGIAAGILFVAETSAGLPMTMARVASSATNTTPAAEAAGLDFWTRTGGAALTARWSITPAGSFAAKADNVYAVGDNGNRLSDVVANQHRSFNASGDANASVQQSTAGFALGLGGAVPLSWSLNINAGGAGIADLGNNNRLNYWGATGGWGLKLLNTDVNATVAATNTITGGSLSFGVGGATALDTRFLWASAKTLVFDDAAGGSTGTLAVKGTLSTQARTLGHVFTAFGLGATYVVQPTDDVVCYDTTAGAGAVNLPAVATVPEGHRVIVKSSGAVGVVNALNVTPAGAETIDLVGGARVLATGTLKVTLIARNSGGVTGWYTI